MKTNRLHPIACLSSPLSQKENPLRLHAAWKQTFCQFSNDYLRSDSPPLKSSISLDHNKSLKPHLVLAPLPHLLTLGRALRSQCQNQRLAFQLFTEGSQRSTHAPYGRLIKSTNGAGYGSPSSAQQVTLELSPLSSIKLYKMGKQLMPCVLDGLYSHGLSLKMEF